jgi:hypothetical protein
MGWQNFVAEILEAGNTTIINAAGDFIYNGPPTSGNLIASLTPAQVTDPYTNLAQFGITAYSKRIIVPIGYWAGNINGFGLTISNALTESGPWVAIGGYLYRISTLATGPATGISMFNSVSGAIITLPDGGGTPQVQITGTVVASDPSNGFVEQWHTVSLAAGWSQGAAPLRYQLLPDGNVQLSGFATHAVFTVTTQVSAGALPAAYTPTVAQDIPGAYNTSTAVSGANVGTDGIIRCRSNGSTTTTCAPQGIYPVN